MLRTFLTKCPRNRNLQRHLSDPASKSKLEKGGILEKPIAKINEKIVALEEEIDKENDKTMTQTRATKMALKEYQNERQNSLTVAKFGAGTATKNVRGLSDFFRKPEFWEKNDMTSTQTGKAWGRHLLKDLTNIELHEVKIKLL